MQRQGRILVVDDDTAAREILGEYLSDEGFAVETAADGRSALAKLERFSPDLVVTDLEMPGMDGMELIRSIQTRDPGRPTLLMTGHDAQAVAAPGREGRGGPVICLQKPLDLDDLILTIHRIVGPAGPTLDGDCAPTP